MKKHLLIIFLGNIFLQPVSAASSASFTIEVTRGHDKKVYQFEAEKVTLSENQRIMNTIEYSAENFQTLQKKINLLHQHFTDLTRCRKNYIKITLEGKKELSACNDSTQALPYFELISGL